MQTTATTLESNSRDILLTVAPGKSEPKRFEDLDVIRGIAIGQVLVWHLLNSAFAKHAPSLARLTSMTWTGVDLFFVLSGYLIGGIVLANRNAPNFYSVFYWRRALRILPVYLILLLAFAQQIHGREWISYATFTQNIFWLFDGKFNLHWNGWSGPLWSLAVEEQFYLFLPLLIRYVSPQRIPKVLVGLCLSAPVFRCIISSVLENPNGAYVLLPCRMDTLLFGVLIAWATRDAQVRTYLQKNKDALSVCFGILSAGFIIMVFAGLGAANWQIWTFGYSWIAATYGCLLTLVILRSDRRIPAIFRPLAWLGIGAYSIYLFHRPIELWWFQHLLSSRVFVPALSAIGAFCFAWISYVLIERPCVRLGHKFRYTTGPISAVKLSTTQ